MASNSSVNQGSGSWGPDGSFTPSSSSSGSSGSSGSSSSSSGSSGSSGSSSSSSGNKGYAYTDKYGFTHVTSDLATALRFSKDATGVTSSIPAIGGGSYSVYTSPGQVYDYYGNYGGGYALGGNNKAINLPLPGAVPIGLGKTASNYSDPNDSYQQNFIPTQEEFNQQYAGYLGSLIPSISGSSSDTQGTLSSVATSQEQPFYDSVILTAGYDPSTMNQETKAALYGLLKERGY